MPNTTAYDCIECHGKFMRLENSPLDYVTPVIDGYALCSRCMLSHNGRGKFEQYATGSYSPNVHGSYDFDYEPLATAVILYHLMLDGLGDYSMSNEGWGSCTMIGKYLLIKDGQGFVSYEEFANEAAAEKEYDRLFNEGWGADQYDAYIFDDRSGYGVSFDGKYIGTYPRYQRARAAIRLLAYKTGYYPNCWHESERGNISPVSY